MTDLDTDALRALAKGLVPSDARRSGKNNAHLVLTAADLIDALRKNRDEWAEAASASGVREQRAWKRTEAAEAERDALRRIIAEAPHEEACWSEQVSPTGQWGECDCWKSRAEETR